LRNAVIQGRHNIDVSLIIAPIIHEYIVGVADAAGVEYSEGIEEEDVDMKEIEYSLRSREAEKILSDLKANKEIDLGAMSEESPEVEEMLEEPEVEKQEEPMGLMSRRTV
jgi:methionine synthase II (cobalamin-independent)